MKKASNRSPRAPNKHFKHNYTTLHKYGIIRKGESETQSLYHSRNKYWQGQLVSAKGLCTY